MGDSEDCLTEGCANVPCMCLCVRTRRRRCGNRPGHSVALACHEQLWMAQRRCTRSFMGARRVVGHVAVFPLTYPHTRACFTRVGERSLALCPLLCRSIVVSMELHCADSSLSDGVVEPIRQGSASVSGVRHVSSSPKRNDHVAVEEISNVLSKMGFFDDVGGGVRLWTCACAAYACAWSLVL